MCELHESARQLPTGHLSVRVPWHDDGWKGTVCRRPSQNAACLILNRIRDVRNDELEEASAGRTILELDDQEVRSSRLPGCIQERGSFMAPFDFTRMVSHPYSGTSASHKHFLPTVYRHPPYSAACIPFLWMMSETAIKKAEDLGLDYRPEFEPELGFKTIWVQDKSNQLALLDTFFSAIKPTSGGRVRDGSLCFFYAKLTPLSDDSRRVIVGVGRVTSVGSPLEYEYSVGDPPHRSVIWERAVQHSIRPSFEDGFLLPYQELLEYLDRHPGDIDPRKYLAFAPEEYWGAFSYGAEHVSSGGAIQALLSCSNTLRRISEVLPGGFERQIEWIDSEVNRLWKMRGPFPGLGSTLKAFGIPQGNLIAFELASAQEQSEDQWTEDPWDLVEQILGNPKSAPGDLYRFVGGTYWDLWQSLSGERRTLLKLLSRFELSEDQAVRYYEPAERQRSGIAASDKEIIENPFLLYELDRDDPDPISIKTIDQGAFPDDVITQRFPIAGDSGWSSIHPHESPSPHGCKHAPMSQEILAITIVLKNGISTVPTTHHVVNGTIVLYSRHSWHNQEHTHSKLKAPCCGVVSFTPFSQYLSSFHVA